jgi:hypothetical protein
MAPAVAASATAFACRSAVITPTLGKTPLAATVNAGGGLIMMPV